MIKKITGFSNSYRAAFIAALGGLLFGYDTGVISGALAFVRDEFHLSILEQEMTVSSVVIGALLGSLFSSWFVDHFGRRLMLMVSAIGFLIGTMLVVSADGFGLLLLGRLIVGIAIGISSYTTPLFISELSPALIRGTLVLINAITISGGEALSFLVDYLLAPQGAWRWMFAIGFIPAILLFIGMLKLPPNLKNKLKDVQTNFSSKMPVWPMLFSKEIRPILWIGIILGVFQQFFGINTIMYYGPTIIESIGFSNTSSQLIATFFLGIINTIFSVVCFYLVDRVGRRKLLLTGSAIAAISLLMIAIMIPHITEFLALRFIAILCLVLYIAGYCISVGSLFWLIIAEIFPAPVRGLGMSIATAVQWAANLLVSISFLSLINILGPSQVFFLYSMVCILCLIFCYYKVPEMTGIRLEFAGVYLHEAQRPQKVTLNN